MRNTVLSLITILLFFISSVRAGEKRDIDVTLLTTTHLDGKNFFQLQVKGNDLIVNGLKREPSTYLTLAEHLRTLINPKKRKLTAEMLVPRCSAGTYKHVIQNGKQKKWQEGCLEDPEFGKIQKAFAYLNRSLLYQKR